MADYKKMYFYLSGQVAGAIESLLAVVEALKKAQQATEEMFMSEEEPLSEVFPQNGEKENA